MDLPDVVRTDLGEIIVKLSRQGWSVSEHEVGSMHSHTVRFDGPRPFGIVCDRGQLFLEGGRQELERAGMFRVFDDPSDFARALWAYLEDRAGDDSGRPSD